MHQASSFSAFWGSTNKDIQWIHDQESNEFLQPFNHCADSCLEPSNTIPSPQFISSNTGHVRILDRQPDREDGVEVGPQKQAKCFANNLNLETWMQRGM